MKSARGRAEEVLRALGDAAPSDYPERVTALMERHLEEHARDQRATCAWVARDTAGNAPAHAFARDLAQALCAEVLDAPAPGEEQ